MNQHITLTNTRAKLLKAVLARVFQVCIETPLTKRHTAKKSHTDAGYALPVGVNVSRLPSIHFTTSKLTPYLMTFVRRRVSKS